MLVGVGHGRSLYATPKTFLKKLQGSGFAPRHASETTLFTLFQNAFTSTRSLLRGTKISHTLWQFSKEKSA